MTRIPKKEKKSVHDRDRIIIRLPDGLHDKLQKAAEDTGQNMTQVAVSLMQWGLARYNPKFDKETNLESNADAVLFALAEIVKKGEDALSAFNAILLGDKKK